MTSNYQWEVLKVLCCMINPPQSPPTRRRTVIARPQGTAIWERNEVGDPDFITPFSKYSQFLTNYHCNWQWYRRPASSSLGGVRGRSGMLDPFTVLLTTAPDEARGT